MPQVDVQKIKRRKMVALFFVVGFATSAAINLLWAYSSLHNPGAFLTSTLPPKDLSSSNWSYSLLLPIVLASCYALAARSGWLSFYLPSVERALIAVLILVVGWNFYRSANLLSAAVFAGYEMPAPLVSCIYALTIALALFTFTGVWNRPSAVGLILILILSPLLVEIFLMTFGELLSMVGINGYHLLFPWFYVLLISLSVALQTGLCGYWLAHNQRARFTYI